MKTCSACKTPKELSQFYRKCDTRDGLTSRCKHCVNVANEKWDRAHPDLIRSVDRASKKKNAKKVSTRIAAWNRRNRNKIREYENRRNRAFPEIARAKQHARRAKLARAEGKYAPAEARELWSSYLGLCAYCPSKAIGLDHVVPLSNGGGNDISNLIPACGSCNSSKGAKSLLVFLAERAA